MAMTDEKRAVLKKNIVASAALLLFMIGSFAMGWIVRDAQLLSSSNFQIVVTDKDGKKITVPVNSMHKIIKP